MHWQTRSLDSLLARAFLFILLAMSCQISSAQVDSSDEDLLLIIPSIIASSRDTNANNGSLCEGFSVNDKSDQPMQARAKPAPGETYRDEVFASRITRITNSSAINSGVIKTLYSTIQAWNADESLMVLWHRGEGHYLYDGKNYALLSRLDIVPSDIEQLFWSTSNPNILYYPNQAVGRTVQTSNGNYRTNGKELMQYDVRQNQHRVLKDFSGLCSSAKVTAGNDVQMISYDDDVFGFRCGSVGFSYRVSSDTVTNLSGSAESEAPQSLPSGQRFFHRGRILSNNLSVERELDLGKRNEHSSLGRLHNGHDAYFAVAFDPNLRNSCGDGIGSVVMHDATNASCRVLVGPANGYPYTLSGTHISAVAHQRPGWMAVSSIGYGIEGDTLLEQELYLVNTDPSDPSVCRIAHHRATGRRGSIGYFAEPHPVISPSGTRILFSSDWNNSGSVDTYVVELPSYR